MNFQNLDKNLQRASTGFLCEMSVDRMSLDIIYKENHVSHACKWTAWSDRNYIFLQKMAVQNELLNLLQAESEATVVYAAIVLSQVSQITLEYKGQFFHGEHNWSFEYIYINISRASSLNKSCPIYLILVPRIFILVLRSRKIDCLVESMARIVRAKASL